MKLVWSPENALKAYIDTVKSCDIEKSGVAELISAMAAGWNAKFIVETWSYGSVTTTSTGLAVAAAHTGGRHVCIVPDNRSRFAYMEAISTGTTEILVGEPEEVMKELDGIDFLVVDCRRWVFSRVLRLARLSETGAILVGKNDTSGKTGSCGVNWRGVIDGGRRILRTAYLPVENGLDIAHVAGSGSRSSSPTGKRRWVKHIDYSSGEEHVMRIAGS